jgi:hypothetical protein
MGIKDLYYTPGDRAGKQVAVILFLYVFLPKNNPKEKQIPRRNLRTPNLFLLIRNPISHCAVASGDLLES